jgi:hypothetical protein
MRRSVFDILKAFSTCHIPPRAIFGTKNSAAIWSQSFSTGSSAG